MFKGLLIRALTICNNQDVFFFKAFVHYSQGLVSTGVAASSLLRVWQKFSFENLSNPLARRNLTAQFKGWLSQQNFTASKLNGKHNLKRQRTDSQEL